jgi:hypothetical protein
MSLSKQERTKQNQQNAQQSTGPKTEHGKRISSRNSFVHGLTSNALTLPHENPAETQARLDSWTESLQPQGYHEEELVGQIALASIRLGRLTKAENEFLADQALMAQFEWNRTQETRLLQATRLMKIDPAMAHIELKSFGSGVEWMIGRWSALKDCLKESKRLNNISLIHELIRLEGADPNNLGEAHISAYEITALACACTQGYERVPEMMALMNQAPPEWVGREVQFRCAPEFAVEGVNEHIDARMEELSILARYFERFDKSSHDGAIAKSGLPDDSTRSRLLLRYRKAAESNMEKAMRALQKSQAERRKQAENEKKAEEKASREKKRNEPKLAFGSPQGQVQHGSCVRLNGVDYEVLDRGEGSFCLCPMTYDDLLPAPEVAVPTLRVV